MVISLRCPRTFSDIFQKFYLPCLDGGVSRKNEKWEAEGFDLSSYRLDGKVLISKGRKKKEDNFFSFCDLIGRHLSSI